MEKDAQIAWYNRELTDFRYHMSHEPLDNVILGKMSHAGTGSSLYTFNYTLARFLYTAYKGQYLDLNSVLEARK